jgi:hypothetical protein
VCVRLGVEHVLERHRGSRQHSLNSAGPAVCKRCFRRVVVGPRADPSLSGAVAGQRGGGLGGGGTHYPAFAPEVYGSLKATCAERASWDGACPAALGCVWGGGCVWPRVVRSANLIT